MKNNELAFIAPGNTRWFCRSEKQLVMVSQEVKHILNI